MDIHHFSSYKPRMSRGTRQTHFLSHPAFTAENRREHGGFLRAGKRKVFRPIDPKKALHVVLRSERARGEWSMLRVRHEKRVKHLVYWAARRHGVRVYRFANSGNHLHLVVYARKREAIQRYLKTAAGLIARAVTGAKKGVKKGRFWDALAYTRVVSWGRELRNVSFYVIMNELESLGIWSRNWKSATQQRLPHRSTQSLSPD